MGEPLIISLRWDELAWARKPALATIFSYSSQNRNPEHTWLNPNRAQRPPNQYKHENNRQDSGKNKQTKVLASLTWKELAGKPRLLDYEHHSLERRSWELKWMVEQLHTVLSRWTLTKNTKTQQKRRIRIGNTYVEEGNSLGNQMGLKTLAEVLVEREGGFDGCEKQKSKGMEMWEQT